jgi:hypothetical protein
VEPFAAALTPATRTVMMNLDPIVELIMSPMSNFGVWGEILVFSDHEDDDEMLTGIHKCLCVGKKRARTLDFDQEYPELFQ